MSPETIRSLLDELGLTAYRASQLLGITPGAVHQWLSGDTAPSRSQQKLLDRLGDLLQEDERDRLRERLAAYRDAVSWKHDGAPTTWTPESLRETIERMGLSVSGTATMLGVRRATVHEWLRGRYRIDTDRAQRLPEAVCRDRRSRLRYQVETYLRTHRLKPTGKTLDGLVTWLVAARHLDVCQSVESLDRWIEHEQAVYASTT